MARLDDNSVRTMYVIAYAGLLPLVAALVAATLPELNPFPSGITERATLGYGVMILGFLGGVRWGLALQLAGQATWTFLAGAAGAAFGIVVLLSPYHLGLALLIVGFGGQGAWDVLAAYRAEVPTLYARLRRTLTLTVCGVLALLFAAHALPPVP